MQTVEALKNLYKKVTKEEAPATSSIPELIQALADKWPEASEASKASKE